jgi:hypothetical protein
MSKHTQSPARTRLDVLEVSHNQTPLTVSEVQQTKPVWALAEVCTQLGTEDCQAGGAQVYWEEIILL